MKDLKMMFEGSEVKIIVNEKGEPLFDLYSTGKALGYSRWMESVHHVRPKKIELTKY